ncbi:hypothetical protein DV495_001580 [Geotrichum candidum]|nr:hypothetical protein DV454_004224 [Geotrichum candidum]KAF5132173.1 hypothetical protein DV495_001580 [Geotrichum candidum]KAF7497346.1 hypothetical protein DV113_004629 [Geotrichum candidum]KAI8131693.1 hypothetical protein DUD61_004651 [Geotrichum candidum]
MPTSSTSVATGLIIGAVSFSLGVCYSNWSYDYYTLWQQPVDAAFERSLAHYQNWYNMPMFFHHVHHLCAVLGMIGFFFKLYKPSEANKLFDGGSLFLYMVGVVIYLTNLRRGGASAVANDWGEVDEHTGINIIAASQVLIVLTFLGVIGLQIGQYWAEIEDSKLAAKAQEEEEAAIAASNAARADAEKTQEPAEASASTKTDKAESTALPAKKSAKKTKGKSKK